MSVETANALVDESVKRLWSPEGADALAYLTGPERGLSPKTIRAARLGWAPAVEAVTRDGRPYVVTGVVTPWIVDGVPTLIKVRQPDGRRPKYAEIFRDRGRHVGIYPDPLVIRSGHPLVAVEGEFDALVLGAVLRGLASVVTLGSASARPDPSALGRMLAATPWLVATDGDEAGERSAAWWPASARRVRPPIGKDWTEVAFAGVNLRRWWSEMLAGVEHPPLFTWEELATWRWGPGLGDPTPGIDRGRRSAIRESPT